MALQIRRGPTTDRTGKTFAEGELVYDTTEKAMYIGDGVTVGGKAASTYTDGQATNAVGASLENGAGNVTFTIVSDTQIDASVTLDGIGLLNVVEDTSPQLGGGLDLNGKDVTGTGNVNITGSVTATSFSGPLTGDVTGNASGNAGTVTNGIYTGHKFYVGTEEIDISRASNAQTLAGVSISGNAATANKLTAPANINGVAFDGSADAVVLTAGTGVTVDGTAVSIGQAVATTSNVSFNDLTVSGNLTVNGTTTTINSTELAVADKNITLAVVAGTPNNAAADGAGITIKGTDDKTLTYSATGDKFVFNKPVDATAFNGDVTGDVTGNVTGNVTGIVAGAGGSTLIGNLTGDVYASNGSNKILESGTNGSDAEFTGSVIATGTSRILLGNGTDASPSIAFDSDGGKDTGLFWGGDGLINVASNAVQTAQFGPSGALILGLTGNGSLTSNSIYVNDIRTGLANANGGYIKFFNIVDFAADVDFTANVAYRNFQTVFIEGFEVKTSPTDIKVNVTPTIATFNIPVQFGRFTTTERDTLTAAGKTPPGTIIFNTTVNEFQGFNNSAWVTLG